MGREADLAMHPESQNATPHKGYRERIYGRYVSAFKGASRPADAQRALDRQCGFFDHLLAAYKSQAGRTKLLEVGCGPGHLLYWAKKRGFASARGFDLSAEQVQLARQLGLDAEIADFRVFLSKEKPTSDLVVAMDVIEHLTRDEAFEFLDLCRHALRPGGSLFLTTPNGAGLRPGPIIFGDLTHETIFSPSTISLALQLAGFENIEVREIVPPIRSFKSAARRAIWTVVRLWPLLLDLVEKGSLPTRVCSRVMAVHAIKPNANGLS